jgi:uracil-DNA glycosylase
MGLCFSVSKPVPPPPSLKNIYKALDLDEGLKQIVNESEGKLAHFKTPKHGDLTKWAE